MTSFLGELKAAIAIDIEIARAKLAEPEFVKLKSDDFITRRTS